MGDGSVNLSGRTITGEGAPAVGKKVELYKLADYETSIAGGADVVTDTYSGGTDTGTGRWNFDAQDPTESWVVEVTDGLKKYSIDGENDLQLAELDLQTSLSVDTIYEHTSGSGVTIDGTLIKDGVFLFGNGAVGAPSISFANSPTSGFYRSGVDTIGVALAGGLSIELNANLLDVKDGTTLELNELMRWDTAGDAIASGAYQFGRDDSTVLHANVPTGATFEWSVNDVAALLLTPTKMTVSGDLHVANGQGVVVGHGSKLAVGGLVPELQVVGAALPGSSLGLILSAADANGPVIHFGKSRGSALGTFDATLSDNDVLGSIVFSGGDTADLSSTGAIIRARIDGTPGDNDFPTELVFSTTADGASGATVRMILNPSGMMLINETANAKMTVGLTINQGANSNEILAFKASDVGHAMTDFAEANTYFTVKKIATTSGGASLSGFKDADGSASGALNLNGTLGEAVEETDTTNSRGVISITAFATDGGTGRQGIAAAGNLLTIVNGGINARLLLKGDGALHVTNRSAGAGDVVAAALADEFDDIGLIRYHQRSSYEDMGVAISKWDAFVADGEEDLKRLGVLSSQGDFRIIQRYEDLLGGAIWQLNTKLLDMNEALHARLDATEQRLLAAGA